MKDKIINVLLNLIKIKSIATFVCLGLMIYMVVTRQIESATVVAIFMMVFKNLFDKGDDKNV